MYNYYQQQQRPLFLKGRPVSSIDEAKSSAIDFDGSIFYFPDLGNNRIYTKQINMDGTASFNMYEFKQIEEEPKVEYVTKEEFLAAIEKLTAQAQPQTTTATKPAAPLNF